MLFPQACESFLIGDKERCERALVSYHQAAKLEFNIGRALDNLLLINRNCTNIHACQRSKVRKSKLRISESATAIHVSCRLSCQLLTLSCFDLHSLSA